MKDALKDLVYRRIGDLGFALTPRAYAADLEIASCLRKLFAWFRVACVLDVGANEGQYRNFLRRRCSYRGLILSFEPVRQTFEVLRAKAARDQQWQVFNCALGATDGQGQLNVMRDTTFSSFLEPQESDVLKSDMKNVVDRTETVTIRRLDGWMREQSAQYNLERVYLKMDTQGHDLEVMRGLGAETSRVAALQSEVSVKQIYKGMPGYLQSVQALASYGFEPVGLFPVNHDELFRAIEFDCVAVNTKLALQRRALEQ